MYCTMCTLLIDSGMLLVSCEFQEVRWQEIEGSSSGQNLWCPLCLDWWNPAIHFNFKNNLLKVIAFSIQDTPTRSGIKDRHRSSEYALVHLIE